MVWCGTAHRGMVWCTLHSTLWWGKIKFDGGTLKYNLGWGGTERRMVWRAKGCSGASLGQWQVTGKRPLNFLTKVLKPRISVVSLWVLFRYRCVNRCVNWDTMVKWGQMLNTNHAQKLWNRIKPLPPSPTYRKCPNFL